MEYLIKCPICEYSSKKSANVIRHLESKHKANSTHIDEFRRRLASSRAHELRGIRAWTCGLCGTTIPSKLGLERHIYRRHRMEYATREGKSLLMRVNVLENIFLFVKNPRKHEILETLSRRVVELSLIVNWVSQLIYFRKPMQNNQLKSL